MGWHGLAAKNQQINLSFFSYIAICFIWLEVCQFYEKKNTFGLLVLFLF